MTTAIFSLLGPYNLVLSIASIRPSRHGLAVTTMRELRSAALVEQRPNDEWRQMADTVIASVNDLLLVIDEDRVPMTDRVHLIATAAKDSGSLYQAIRAGIHAAGDGAKAQLPAASDAGFLKDDAVSVHTADHVHIVTDRSPDAERLASDLVLIRANQANG